MNLNKVFDNNTNETVIPMEEIPGTHNSQDQKSKEDNVNTRSNKNIPINRRPSFFLEAGNRLVPRPMYGSDDVQLYASRNRRTRLENDNEDYMDVYDTIFDGHGRPSINSGSVVGSVFDVNIYQQKKTLAQGMMDLALISANANQLRYVMQYTNHPFHYLSLAMIVLSLLLQVVVGIGLIWNSRYDVKEDEQIPKANKTNNWTVVGIFLVTILNVFISSFGITDPDSEVGVDLPFKDIDQDTIFLKNNNNVTSVIT
ncbi:uncharacterized protein LOC141536555 [Cotesia typhae]|uniref:uncharacterized protein LOC141536555 n=1 Tax=Cotesia typhae TaxID=2053667 RepID=UPI003D691AE0